MNEPKVITIMPEYNKKPIEETERFLSNEYYNIHMNKKLFNWITLKIMTLFTSDLTISLHGREIARKLKMNQRTAKLYLDVLEKEKILAGEIKGRNKEFTLKRSALSKRLLTMAEQYKMFMLFANFEVYDIVSSIMDFAEIVIVFGSFAKGYSRKDSDLDILLIGRAEMRKINKIKEKYARKIHVVHMRQKQFIARLKEKDNFVMDVLHDHVICSGFENFTDLRWNSA